MSLGDPECPDEVKRAKRAHWAMENKMTVGQMDDDAAGGNDNSALQPHQSEESDGDDFGRDLDDIDVSSTHESPDQQEIQLEPIVESQPAIPVELDQPQNATDVGVSSSSRPHKRPRHRATPRLGQTPSALSGLTRALQENRSIPAPSGVMSHTATGRLNVDKALESLGSQQNDSALLMLITMIDKRESERLSRQEESDRKMREEAIL